MKLIVLYMEPGKYTYMPLYALHHVQMYAHVSFSIDHTA